jgi:hypothetical protein
MKLSIEAIVAVAVAVVFAGLSICAIAQEQSERGTQTNNSVLRHMTARGFNSSSSAPLGGRSESQLLAQY